MPNTYNRETERTRLRGKVIRALPQEQDWNRLDFIDLTLSTFTCYLREKSKTGVCVCLYFYTCGDRLMKMYCSTFVRTRTFCKLKFV